MVGDVSDMAASHAPASDIGAEVAPDGRRSVDEIERILDDVEAALARLDDGSYGRCSSCGSAIDEERLVEMPATSRCASCATADTDG